MKRHFQDKVCVDCRKLYTPNSGRQVRCDDCRAEKKKDENRRTQKARRQREKAERHRQGRGRGQKPRVVKAKPKPKEEEPKPRKRREFNAEIAMRTQERLARRIPPMANIKDGERPIDAEDWRKRHGLA